MSGPHDLFGPPQDNASQCGMSECTGDVCNQKGLYCVACLCASCKRSKCVTATFLREAHSW